MVCVLSERTIAEILDLGDLLPVLADAFRKQRDGDVERPDRPHFPVGRGLDDHEHDRDRPLGTGLTMPAYLHGADHYATKLASVHEGNPDRALPTVQAQIALTAAATGEPAAYMAGTLVTNARTGCIGGLAVQHLARTPVRLGVVGAGTQARWQSRAVAAATDLSRIRVYSPSDSRHECAADLRSELGVEVVAVDSAREAVSEADAVITATTATEPVFPGAALEPGAVVVAVGAYTGEMRELDAETIRRAGALYADVPSEAAEVGDLPDHSPADLRPIADAFEEGRPELTGDEVVVVESVGSAVLDAAAADHLFSVARDRGVGADVEL
jgi:alanine dehydrogenase